MMNLCCDVLKALKGKTLVTAESCTGGMIGGALTAVGALAGLLNSNGDLEARNSKAATFKIVRGIMEEFAQMNGSVICHELKGMETGKMLRSCRDCVIDAATLAEKHLFADK